MFNLIDQCSITVYSLKLFNFLNFSDANALSPTWPTLQMWRPWPHSLSFLSLLPACSASASLISFSLKDFKIGAENDRSNLKEREGRRNETSWRERKQRGERKNATNGTRERGRPPFFDANLPNLRRSSRSINATSSSWTIFLLHRQHLPLSPPWPSLSSLLNWLTIQTGPLTNWQNDLWPFRTWFFFVIKYCDGRTREGIFQ